MIHIFLSYWKLAMMRILMSDRCALTNGVNFLGLFIFSAIELWVFRLPCMGLVSVQSLVDPCLNHLLEVALFTFIRKKYFLHRVSFSNEFPQRLCQD